MRIDHSSSLQPTPLKADKPITASSGFADLIDTINPLQHLPVVSTLYQNMTGDNISTAAKLAGDAAYGGVVGVVSSLANIVSEEITGKDILEHVVTAGEDTDLYAVQQGTALQADTNTSFITEDTATPAQTKTTTSESLQKAIDKKFYEFSAEEKKSKVSSLGFENENIRQQFLMSLYDNKKDMI